MYALSYGPFPRESEGRPGWGQNARKNLQGGRATCGKRILVTLSRELTAEFGAGFSYTALTRMARFAEWITDDKIVATLSQELSWSHFIEQEAEGLLDDLLKGDKR